MHPQAKRKASVGVTWPTPKAKAILYMIYPYEDNGFITLGVRSPWVISHSELPLPTSHACHRKVKIICLYQIFALNHYLHMSSICQIPALSPPALPTPWEGIEEKRTGGHMELEGRNKQEGGDGVKPRTKVSQPSRPTPLRCGSGSEENHRNPFWSSASLQLSSYFHENSLLYSSPQASEAGTLHGKKLDCGRKWPALADLLD